MNGTLNLSIGPETEIYSFFQIFHNHHNQINHCCNFGVADKRSSVIGQKPKSSQRVWDGGNIMYGHTSGFSDVNKLAEIIFLHFL